MIAGTCVCLRRNITMQNFSPHYVIEWQEIVNDYTNLAYGNRTDVALYIEKVIAAKYDRFREITVKYNNIPCTNAGNEGKTREEQFYGGGETLYRHFVTASLRWINMIRY